MADAERPERAEVARFTDERARVRAERPDIAALLDFEEVWEGREAVRDWNGRGFSTKTMAILDQFGYTRATYTRKLLAAVDEQDGLAYAPALVKRIVAARERGRAVRQERVDSVSSP